MGDSNILVIGNGGREHAICWKLSQSKEVTTIYAAPGNVGIETVEKVQNVNLDVSDHKKIVQWCKSHNISLVVVGPEGPLADGLADALNNEGM